MVFVENAVGELDCDSSICVADTIWVRGKWRRTARIVSRDKSFVESDNERGFV